MSDAPVLTAWNPIANSLNRNKDAYAPQIRPGVLVVATCVCKQFFALADSTPLAAVEELLISYAVPTVTFLHAKWRAQRGFLREQNLDIKFFSQIGVDRAAL